MDDATYPFVAKLAELLMLMLMLMGLIHESVKEEFKGEINLSIEKIALMTDISFRRGLQGFLSAFTSICGLFLFSMISSNDAEYDVILAAGGSGLFACVGCLVSEVYSVLKASSRIERESGGDVEWRSNNGKGRLVEECSWMFVWLR